MVKKRILALLMAVIIITQLCVTVVPVIAEDVENADDKSIIGSLVRFNTSDTIYMYMDVSYSGPSTATERYKQKDLPGIYVVLDAFTVSYGTLFYKLGTVDGSTNEILEKYPWTKAAYLEIVPDPDEGLIKDKVDLTDGVNKLGELSVVAGQKSYVYANFGSEIGDEATYNWQLLVDKENYVWADIYDYHYPYAVVSESLMMNALDEEGKATLRCIVTDGDAKYVSNKVRVSIQQPVAVFSKLGSYASGAPEADQSMQRAIVEAFDIIIKYEFLHENAVDKNLSGSTAAETLTFTLPPNTGLDHPITSPYVAGYKPYIEWTEGHSEAGAIEYASKKLVPADRVDFEDQREDIIVTVYYVPQEVNFIVRHFIQNLQNDEYLELKTEIKKGTADTEVGSNLSLNDNLLPNGDLKVDDDLVGFSGLYYDKNTRITNDGNATVEIYYDRIYYLVNYNLGEGAYGVMPSLVRYGTSFMLGNPTRPGYAFDGWNLTSVKDSREEDAEELLTDATRPIYQNYNVTQANSQITIAHNLVYEAKWEKAKTSYTVIYWLENADDSNFSMAGFKTVEAQPGDVVSAKDDITRADKANFTFNATLSDKNVTVKGDGTTSVNVYYLRKYYTLTFSSADRSCLTDEHQHDASCPSGTCSLNVHTHTDECGVASQTCGKVDHKHGEACCSIEYHEHEQGDCVCSAVEHTHTDACYTCVEHQHTLDCYDHELTCYSTRTDQLKAPENRNDYTANIDFDDLQSGYVYRYRVRNGTYHNYFYFEGAWYYLGTRREIADIRNTYGITVPNALGNPTSNGTYSLTLATNNCDCVPDHIEHTHGDEACTYKDDVHIHGEGTCPCKLIEHNHIGGCDYTGCDIEPHTHTSACQTYKCGKTEHTHNADCVRACQMQVHTHGNCGRTFLIVKKKYGASISDVWQEVWNDSDHVNGIRWSPSGTTYTAVLVYFPFMPGENITLTANTGGSKEFTMHYLLESLNSNGNLDDPSNYTELVAVEAKYGYLTKKEDFFDIVGFIQYKSNPAFNSSNQVSTAGNVYLYYERLESTLTFMSDGSALTSLTKNLMYEQPIGAEYEPISVPYPISKEKNAVKFAGWYTTENCADGTEFYFDGSTIMPLEGLYLYAKWESTSWDVEVYLDDDQTIPLYSGTVPFDSRIAEPQYKAAQLARPEYKDLIWAGWYYTDANGKEVRFDFSTMAIKSHYKGKAADANANGHPTAIYAKWTSEVPIKYTVYYVIDAGDGNYINVAAPTEGVALAGVAKSFVAKAGDDIYSEYRQYLPRKRSITHAMSVISEENKIYFFYETVHEITYTIKHVFTNSKFNAVLGKDTYELSWNYSIQTSDPDFSSKLVINFDADLYSHVVNDNASLWSIIEDLSPNAYRQEFIITSDDDNEIVFYWEDRGEIFIYQVIHYFQKVNYASLPAAEQYEPDYYQEFMGAYAEQSSVTIKAKPVEMQGFAVNNSKGTLSMTLNKTDDGIKRRVLEVYYDREEIDYIVQYVYGGTVDVETKTAIYEESVTETAKAILGYVIADPAKAEQTVSITHDGQIISFYYVAQQVIYNYQVAGNIGGYLSNPQEVVPIGSPTVGSTPTAYAGYIFIGWYTDAAATQKVSDSWVDADGTLKPVPAISDANLTVTFYAKFAPFSLTIQNHFNAAVNPNPALDIGDQAFIYNIQGIAGTATAGVQLRVAVLAGQTKEILALPIGNYVVTVESAWSWRYQTINHVSIDKADGGSDTIENISNMTWNLAFGGSNIMIVTYDIPTADVSGTTQSNTYFFVTDNAHGGSSQSDK